MPAGISAAFEFVSCIINESNINYKNYHPLDLLKILSDRVLFYNVESSSIKNMLYANKLFYQVFEKECQIESYLYRVINEKVNRMLIFTGNFSCKNNAKLISIEQKEELINNINNDIIYLADNIILIRYQVFLPWLWKCRSNPIEQLENLNVKKYNLKNKWSFSND